MKTIFSVFALLLLAGFVTLPVLAANLEDSLVAYWTFNEGKGETASDESGNGHDGTLMGTPEWTDGYYGGGIEFSAGGDEVNVPYHKDLNSDTFTICAWANVAPGSEGAHRAVVSSRNDAPLSGYIFYAEPGNTWQYWTGVGGSWNSVQGPAVTPGKWQHLAGVYAGGKQKFYVNGKLEGEKDAALNINPDEEFLIGAGANERAVHEYLFRGIIDEVRLYDRELNAGEISQVMENEAAAVEPAGKLAVTWGQLKARK